MKGGGLNKRINTLVLTDSAVNICTLHIRLLHSRQIDNTVKYNI